MAVMIFKERKRNISYIVLQVHFVPDAILNSSFLSRLILLHFFGKRFLFARKEGFWFTERGYIWRCRGLIFFSINLFILHCRRRLPVFTVTGKVKHRF